MKQGYIVGITQISFVPRYDEVDAEGDEGQLGSYQDQPQAETDVRGQNDKSDVKEDSE